MTDEPIHTTDAAASSGDVSGAAGGNPLLAEPVPTLIPEHNATDAPTTVPASTAASPNAGTPPAPVQELKESPELPAENETVSKNVEAAGEAGKAAPATPSISCDKKIVDDIAGILATIKLPERRSPPASEAPHEIKKGPVTFDTALGADVAKSSEEKVEVAMRPSNRTASSAPVVEQPATPPASETPGLPKETPKDIRDTVARLHTLKDDLKGVVQEKKISLVRAVALEEEKRQGQERFVHTETPAQSAHQSRRKLIIAVVSVLLFMFGAAFFYSIYNFMRGSADSGISPQEQPLMFAERTIAFSLGTLADIEIKRSLAQARQSSGSLGSITRIIPTISQVDASGTSRDQPAATETFLNAIGAHVTPELTRALSDNFFLGIHAIDKNAPVLIIPVSSYERAFAGLLAWEPTMNEDLSPFFTPVPSQTIDASGLSVQRQFQDAVLFNYDVRALRDDSGAVELLYSFPTRSVLIIAESPNSFTEILSRLRASRQL